MYDRLVRVAVVLTTLVIAASARADDAATGATLYDRAEQLAKAGKLDEACPLYAASFKADPQLGVLLHLADCNEKIGKTATAWVEFRDAVERAHKMGDTREAYAQGRVDALAPRLARLRVDAPKPPVPGLVVKRGDTDITLLLDSDAPVDPGEHVVVVTAPGHAAWETKVTAEAGKTATLQITLGAPITATTTGPGSAVPAEHPPEATRPPLPRWGGVRAFAGTSIDGFGSQPSNCNGGTSQFCGQGERAETPGVLIGARVRVNFNELVSFDPGLALHVRRIYTEHCSPCMQTDTINVNDIEIGALFRLAPVHGRFQLSLLAGPVVALRVRVVNDFMLPAMSMNPTAGAGQFDIEAVLALELFYGRFGGQIVFQQGTQNLSTTLDAPIQSIGVSLGFRI
jgi:hypothetical protein